MRTPKLAKRSPWIWIGLCLVLVTGVTVAAAGRNAPVRPAESRRAPAATAVSAGGAGDARADRDVCAQQLD